MRCLNGEIFARLVLERIRHKFHRDLLVRRFATGNDRLALVDREIFVRGDRLGVINFPIRMVFV